MRSYIYSVWRRARWLLVVALPSCAFCVDNTINPIAEEHVHFGVQYLSEGKLVEAESRCKIAIEYAPKYAEPYNCLGLVEYHRAHHDRAIDLFKTAISLKSDFPEALNNLGAIYLERREYPVACDMFKQAIEIDPGY